MKKLFISLSFILCAIISHAQTIGNTIDTVRLINDTAITGQTRVHGVTHQIEGFIIDTALGLIKRAAASIGTSPTLQSVTDNGNSTTDDVIINSTSKGFKTVNGSTSTYMLGSNISTYTGATRNTFLGIFGGIPELILKDHLSLWTGIIQSGPLTANRTILMPDETTANGIGIPSTVLLHTSKNPLVIGVASSDSAVLSGGNLHLTDALGSTVDLNDDNGLSMQDGSGNVTKLINTEFTSSYPPVASYVHAVDITPELIGLVREGLMHRYGFEFRANVDAVSGLYQINVPLFRSSPLALAGDGIAPAVTVGAAAGSGATCSVVSGDDNSFVLSLTTGTSPLGASGILVSVVFNTPYPSNVRIIPAPSSSNAAALSGTTNPWVDNISATASGFHFLAGTSALSASTTYKWTMIVMK
jgi:hypothetical protein